MADTGFPFPGISDSKKIFEDDPCYGKIPSDIRDEVFKKAWNTGLHEGQKFLEKRGSNSLSMESILCAQGYCIQIQDIDYVMGNTRYFCDMFPKRKKINIYKQSICKWADSHNISYEYAKNIILAHEYFHSIESEKNGWVSKQYLVPMLIIGKLRIGKTGITALSEVAANAFAYEYYCHCEELKSDLNSEDKTEN